MNRLSFLALLGLVALTACRDESTPLLAPDGTRLTESAAERTGVEKPLPGDVSVASTTVAVTDILSGGTSPTVMAQSLAGSGVTIQNVSYLGSSRSGGTYSNGAGTIGFDGIILSSGWAIDVLGPNISSSTSRALGMPGDAGLSVISGRPTYDASVLSFEIIPDADKVYFEYVFSSEEYQEWVNSSFNDAFGFFINGQNCAVIGSPPTPITINNINHLVNTSLFRNNYPPPGTIDIEPDGLTTALVCEASVTPGVPNTVKLAIADASDMILDSWVFIKAGSFSTTPPGNTAPVLDPIANRTVNEGSTVGFTATATDADAGQTLTYSLVGAPAGASIDPGTGVFSWTPTDDDPTGTPSDNHAFTVRVTDDGSPAMSADRPVTITVNNVAPTITSLTAPTAPIELVSGSAVANVSVSFTDPGSGDTHTRTIACGNSTTASPSGNCTYGAAGVYTITATVLDDDGGSDSETFQYVVVYDPSAGFVTGGGWIDSPAGAYAADPTLTGKGDFGFVSKYRRGATAPDGQTQFQFHAGSLNFHSTVYEWLVVAGPKAQYKGSGTINGSGDYGFLLTVNDGQVSGGGGVDRFRIKIWNRSTGAVVYDNQLDDAPDAGATTAIAGGSIVIHSR